MSIAGIAVLAISSLYPSVTPTITPDPVNTERAVPLQRDVLIALGHQSVQVFTIPPQLRYEESATGDSLPSDAYDGDRAASVLMTTAASRLTGLGFRLVGTSAADLDQQRRLEELSAALINELPLLTSSTRDKGALIPLLWELRDISGSDFMLLQRLWAKIGEEESFNFLARQTIRSTSTSTLKVALVSLDEGQVMWSQQTVARSTPSSGLFWQALDQAYPAIDEGEQLPDSDRDGVPDIIDREPNTRYGAEVDYFGVSRDDDGDGVPNGIDRHYTERGRMVNAWGEPLDADHDGVDDSLDVCSGTPLGVPVDLAGCPIRNAAIERIFFEQNSSKLLPESYPRLDDVGEQLTAQSYLRLAVNGHCDDQGSDAYNQKLSLQRAESVIRYITTKFDGVSSTRMIARGFGKSQPRKVGSDEDARAQNRRVEFVVLNSSGASPEAQGSGGTGN